jgi:DNA-binding NtrC family response regulator
MTLKALLDSRLNNVKEIGEILLKEGFEVNDFSAKKALLKEVSKGVYNIIMLGCDLKNIDEVMEEVKTIKELDPRAEIICSGLSGDCDLTIEAIKSGITACLTFPEERDMLIDAIARIKSSANLRMETFQIECSLNEKYKFYDIVSKNPAMLDIFSLLTRVAPYYRTMLITGDTGTGKEVLAKALHDISPVSKEPFIVFNCSGVVETLIESELFGHVKGAFTGALSDKKGLFEAAGKGTIFLDEIGDMPLSVQPHLLRVLQGGEFRSVGSNQVKKADCRVIAATNVDLYKKVKDGEFREDLYFRLAIINIHMPSLRERKDDIPLLSCFFLNRLKKRLGKNVLGITTAAKRLLMSYDWPGNVRELENVLERAVLISKSNYIRDQDLPEYLKGSRKAGFSSGMSLEEVEKNHIERVLLTTGGNRTKAAAILGISRRALLRKTDKYGIKI